MAFYPARMLYKDFVDAGAGFVAPAIVASTAATSDTDYPFLNSIYWSTTDPNAALFAGASSEYTVASFSPGTGRAMKLVGAGIKVWSAGKVVQSSGNYILYAPPNAVSTVATDKDTVSELLGWQSAARHRLEIDKAVMATYGPVIDSDLAAVTQPAVTVSSTTDIRNRLACAILIQKGDPSADYTFEAVAHFELYGQSVPTTRSHSDVHAVPTAVSAVGMLPSDARSNLPAAMSRAMASAAQNGVELVLGEAAKVVASQGRLAAMGALRKGSKAITKAALRQILS